MLYADKEPYVAIIGDIIDSKKLTNRKEIQQIFKETLNAINEKYKNDIAAKFMITLGDEFQGLLKNSNNCMKIIEEIELSLFPVKLRFGIGCGEISTEIDFYNTLEIDGPAYHYARKMIDELNLQKSRYEKRYSNIMICSNMELSDTDNLLNTVLSLCSTLMSNWSPRQVEIIKAYLSTEEDQYKTADILKITQSSVNKSLSASKYYSYRSAINNVTDFFANRKGVHNV